MRHLRLVLRKFIINHERFIISPLPPHYRWNITSWKSPADILVTSRCKSTLRISQQVLKISPFNVSGKTHTKLPRKWEFIIFEFIIFENKQILTSNDPVTAPSLVRWQGAEWCIHCTLEYPLPLSSCMSYSSMQDILLQLDNSQKYLACAHLLLGIPRSMLSIREGPYWLLCCSGLLRSWL